MKTLLTFLLILTISNIIYGQSESRISPSTSVKYVEPYLAVNPVNGDILAVFFSRPARDLEYVFYRNGAIISGGSFPLGIDPSCAFDGNGNAYICYLNGAGYNVLVRKAPSGTFNFGNPVVAVSGTSEINYTDKPLMTIDTNPSSPYYNRIYIATTKIEGIPSIPKIVFSYSTNGGNSFQELSSPLSSSSQTDEDLKGAFPVVTNNGNIFVYWFRANPYTNRYIKFFQAKSTTGGSSFAAEQQILGELDLTLLLCISNQLELRCFIQYSYSFIKI
jgi:hypothetical protein